ncbi:MAG: hypothetical protein J6Y92_11920 [Lentisphaeria bacterium]|nr:hypothetical protein [Lentisphaeria bacterium]
MEPLTEQKPAQIRPRGKNHVLAAFLLGVIAGAAAMFCTGFLYLRHNLIVSYEFPGITADDFDDAFENAMPAESGWKSSREACSLPLPSDGRALYNWKLCNRDYARGLMDDPDHGIVLPALIPCTVSITNDPDGNAVVSRLNTSLLGVIYGGDARRVLRSGIAPEQEALISLLADGIRKEKAQRKENEP